MTDTFMAELDEEVRRFIEPYIVKRPGLSSGPDERSQLGWLLLDAVGGLPEERLALAASSARAGITDLRKLMTERPGHWKLAGGDVEYLLGYVPAELDLVPADDRQRITEWYECVSEIFRIAGQPSEKAADYEKFRSHLRHILPKLARLVVESDDSWRTVKPDVESRRPAHDP